MAADTGTRNPLIKFTTLLTTCITPGDKTVAYDGATETTQKIAMTTINQVDDINDMAGFSCMNPNRDASETMSRHRYWSAAPTKPPAEIADKISSIIYPQKPIDIKNYNIPSNILGGFLFDRIWP
jgi:hypothetical protein